MICRPCYIVFNVWVVGIEEGRVSYQRLPPAVCGSILVELHPSLGQAFRDLSPYRPTINAIVMLIPGISPPDPARSICVVSELLKSRYSPALTLSLPGPTRNWSRIIASIFCSFCK